MEDERGVSSAWASPPSFATIVSASLPQKFLGGGVILRGSLRAVHRDVFTVDAALHTGLDFELACLCPQPVFVNINALHGLILCGYECAIVQACNLSHYMSWNSLVARH